ncbi:hypothetical protein GW17_00046828 [Ensete ventricosum]|nr:hypothetical protein GW17_00046828 [Ensete ventricosum]
MDQSSINSIEWRDLPKPKHPQACISLVMVSVAKRGVHLFHHHHPKHHAQPCKAPTHSCPLSPSPSPRGCPWWLNAKFGYRVLRAILPRQSKKGENQRKDDKKCRKLATFLNSFFNQTIYKKKSQSEKDRNLKEVQAGRRSSSISCSRTIRSNEGYSNGRTNGHQKSVHFSSQREAWCHNRVTSEVWPAERAKSMDGYPENKCVINGNGDGLSKEEALGSEEFMGKQELAMRMEEGVTPALIYLN